MVTAFARVDDNRVLLGDAYGTLILVTLTADAHHQVLAVGIDVLGRTSPASALAYIDAYVEGVAVCARVAVWSVFWEYSFCV